MTNLLKMAAIQYPALPRPFVAHRDEDLASIGSLARIHIIRREANEGLAVQVSLYRAKGS
jgi:hypothetical protein